MSEVVKVEVAGGPSAEVPHTTGLTILGAMELAQGKIEPDPSEQFTFALQYYGAGLGYLVNMVNEVYDSFISRGGEGASPFFYWNVLVNGAPAGSSVDRTPVGPGDTVRLEFKQYSSTEHAGTLMAQKHAVQQGRR